MLLLVEGDMLASLEVLVVVLVLLLRRTAILYRELFHRRSVCIHAHVRVRACRCSC